MFRPSANTSRFINATHLAVVSGDPATSGETLNLTRGEFFGTAFPLAPARGLFVTARHVYIDALSYGKVAVGQVMTSQPQVALVTDAEDFALIDLAILECPGLRTPSLQFDFRPLEYLSEI